MTPTITIGTQLTGKYVVTKIINDHLGPGVLIQHKEQKPVRISLKEAEFMLDK